VYSLVSRIHSLSGINEMIKAEVKYWNEISNLFGPSCNNSGRS
jgi:hypothetical protein